MTVGTRLQLRRNTAANWATDNPILLAGELGVETDTNNVKVGDGATVWNLLGYANGARLITLAPLPTSGVNPLTGMVHADGYGAKSDSGVTDCTTPFANALAAAVAAKVPLYIPSGDYKITAQLDWRGADVVVIGNGSGNTTIRQYTNNVGIVWLGRGERCRFEGFRLIYNTKQTSSNTASVGITIGDSSGSLSRSSFRNVSIQRCAYGVAYGMAVNSAWGGMFSCHFDNLDVTGYAITALELNAPTFNCTGNVFNNTYLNNDWEGDGNDSSAAPCVNLLGNDEIVFNQLNIEHASFSATEALQIGQGPTNVIINGLHCEVLDLNAEGKGLIYATSGTQLKINGFTNEGNNWSAGTTKPIFRVNVDAKVSVDGMSSGYSSFTVAVTNHPIVLWGGSATDADVWLRNIDAGVFSECTTPYESNPTNGCRIWELNQPITPLNAQTGTSYTLVRGDAGCSIRTNNASANTLTVPPNSSVKFPIRTEIEVFQYGTGQTTVTAGGGVTIRSPAGLKLSAQYASAVLRKIATDEWTLVGSTTT